MICVLTDRILIGDIEDRIIRWETWWRTPFGLCKTCNEARNLMKEAGHDPRTTIYPVSVAIGANTHEVFLQ